MKSRRITAVVAAVAASTLFLAGCTSGGDETQNESETGEIQTGTTVAAAQNASTFALNSYTTANYATYNSNVQYFTQSTFNYYNAAQELVRNEDLGTYELVSEDPLTITYNLSEDATWSDGQPITAADLMLTWAANLTKYNDASGDDGAVNFDGIGQGSGLDYVEEIPEVSADGRSITFVYAQPYVDWEVAGIGPNIPAHILWQVAMDDDDISADDAAAAVLEAIETDDTEALATLGESFANDWTVAAMPDDERLLVSSGAYTVTDFVQDQYITLSAREDYQNGPQSQVETFTMRFIPDPTAQVQALQNGEISLLYGQATSDTVEALEDVGEDITTTTTPAASYEHIDLNFDVDGPFSPSAYGGDEAAALAVRQAFFSVVPRQEMLERIIQPLQSDATLDDSALFLPGGNGYDGAVSQGDAANYQDVDQDRARELLEQAGVDIPVPVRFAYATDNPRRVQEFQLLQASAEAEGLFEVEDIGVPAATFFGDDGIAGEEYQWDASVFAYVLSALSVGSSQANTSCDNAYNYGGYCSEKVDGLWQQATTAASYDDAIPFMQQIDAQLSLDAQTLPLFQLPDVSAWESNIENVENAPLTPNIFWNFFDWSVAK